VITLGVLYRSHQVVYAKTVLALRPKHKSIVNISDLSSTQTLDTLKINKTANVMSNNHRDNNYYSKQENTK